MATTDKTPLWLDLKKEYIDDNFDKLKSRFYFGLYQPHLDTRG